MPPWFPSYVPDIRREVVCNMSSVEHCKSHRINYCERKEIPTYSSFLMWRKKNSIETIPDTFKIWTKWSKGFILKAKYKQELRHRRHCAVSNKLTNPKNFISFVVLSYYTNYFKLSFILDRFKYIIEYLSYYMQT